VFVAWLRKRIYHCEAEGSFTLHPDEIECGDWFAPDRVTRWMAEGPQDFASALLLIRNRLIQERGVIVRHPSLV